MLILQHEAFRYATPLNSGDAHHRKTVFTDWGYEWQTRGREAPGGREPRMANRTKLTPKKREQFLECLSAGGSVTLAASLIGMSRRAMYDARKADAEFGEQWENAVDEGTDWLEDEARRRAFEGIDHPVTFEGKITATYKEYSDTLLIFLLKARRPEKYRERVEHTGEGGGPITLLVKYDGSS